MATQSNLPKSPGAAKNLLLIVNYKHEKELGDVLARTAKILGGLDFTLDPIVIDDASPDRSPEIARAAGFTVLRHEKNSGVGSAIRSGLQYGLDHGYDNVVMISGNGKMQPEEIAQVIRPLLLGQADYVQGSRFLEGGQSAGLSLFRSLAIPVFSILTSAVLGRRFSDITCGFRAYRLAWLRDARINLHQEWLNRYELEFYVHYWACRLGIRIVEVPVTILYTHLEAGRKSYIRPITGWWSMMRPFVLLSLRMRR